MKNRSVINYKQAGNICAMIFACLLLLAGYTNAADARSTVALRASIWEASPPTRNVKGKVTDSAGEVLIGVSIRVKGTTTGNITDVNGNFSLDNIDDNAVLVFSYVGYTPQEISIKGQTTINVVMQSDAIVLDEVVAIGYGSIKRSDLTGAIATLGSKDISVNVESKVIDAIQGKVAGMSIESLGGEPGSDMRIQIRGAGSLSNNAPLVLIDGVPGSMDMLNTNNIKSMQILKDASASAIYGARAANGVILIETMGGRKGDVMISAQADIRILRVAQNLELL
jgi:TonB-dependent SusC/RagA subfamily outer membrane receptor